MKSKLRFANAAEEEKYRGYLKAVKSLNSMKEYLSLNHKKIEKNVIKRFVVTIKRME